MSSQPLSQAESDQLNEAVALHQQGKLAEAAPLYQQILARHPDHFDSIHLLGVLATQTRDYDAAQRYLDRALQLQPTSVPALQNAGVLLLALRQPAQALICYERILQIEPTRAATFNDCGIALLQMNRLRDALASFDRALALQPQFAEAHYNRASACLDLGLVADAIDAFQAALALRPDLHLARSYLTQCQWNFCEWADYARRRQEILEGVRAGAAASPPVFFLGVSDSARDQLRCSQIHTGNMVKSEPVDPWPRNPYAHDRIRLAYVSPDFREHAVSYLLAGLIERHDRKHFETIGVNIGPIVNEPMQHRMRSAFDQFIEAGALADSEIVAQLRRLEIDIAIDLTGLTQGGRLGVFAQRPAPVQINYLGFPGTSGAPWMDYIIGDRFVIPEEQASNFSEKVVWMPTTFQANDDQRPKAPRAPIRSEHQLPDGAFVFASFSNNYKITPDVFDVWMKLLRSVETSLLWIVAPHQRSRDNLVREAAARGVGRERLVFAGPTPYPNHLARLALADVQLDTFPFAGGTTASDALWSGLPVVTCCGEAFSSRMAGSLLGIAGVPELATTSLREYEAVALRLAQDDAFRSDVRARLERARYGVLFNTQSFCTTLESAYQTIWKRSRNGETPASFAVSFEGLVPDAKRGATVSGSKAPRSGWLGRLFGQ